MTRLRTMRAMGVTLALLLAVLMPHIAAAASPTHTPTPTDTPAPTSTPYPTYTPPATQTPYPSPTVAPSPSPVPQGPDPTNPHQYCTALFGWCPDLSGFLGAIGDALGGLINGALVAIFSPIEHAYSDAFDTLVKPFQQDLTYTPDIPHEASWAGLRNFQTALQELAGVLFFGFITVGVFARYLEQLGVGDFAQLTSPLRRAVVVTGLLMGYPQLMGLGFTAVNAAADTINGISLSDHETAWQAIRGAMYALDSAFSIQGILDVVVMVVAYVFVILSVVVRDFGIGVLGGLYIVGPLALATFVSPYFDMIAKWWGKTFIAIALWPIGYAVALKLIAIMFAGGGPMSEMGGLSAALAALGLVLVLYKMPALVGSVVGASGAIIGSVASTVTDAGLGAAVSYARQFAMRRLGLP